MPVMYYYITTLLHYVQMNPYKCRNAIKLPAEDSIQTENTCVQSAAIILLMLEAAGWLESDTKGVYILC